MFKSVLIGISASWIRLFASTLIAVLQTPLFFAYLPPDQLGVWYLLFTISTLIFLSDFGLPAVFARAVSYNLGRSSSDAVTGSPEEVSSYSHVPIHELYSSAVITAFLVGAAVSIVCYPLSQVYFASILKDSAVLSNVSQALLIFLIGVIFHFASAIPYACMSGMGNVGLDSSLRTVIQVIGFVLVFTLLPHYHDIRLLSSIYMLQGIVSLTVGHAILARKDHMRLSIAKGFNAPAMKSMFLEALPMFTTKIGLWLIIESNLLIAGYYLTASQIPDFAILRQLVMMGSAIPTAIPIALLPHAAAAHAAGDVTKGRILYRKGLRYGLTVTGLWTCGLLLWTPQVLTLWVGENHFLGYGVLIPLMINAFLELHGTIHSFFVWSVGKWPFAPITVIGGALNFAVASTGCSRWGFEGLSWGTLIAQAVTVHWYGTYFSLRQMGITFMGYARATLMPIATYICILLISGIAIKMLLPTMLGPLIPGFALPIINVSSGILVTISVWAIFAWRFVLYEEDQSMVLNLMGIRRHA